MLNKKWIVLAIIFILTIGLYLTLRLNPPLESSGVSYNSNDPYTIVAEMENKGFTDIKLKEVFVNSNSGPEKVELGVSRSNSFVTIDEVREPSEGISFHKINEFSIQPPPNNEYDGKFDTIRNYALSIHHDEHIDNILMKYSYLGIPFELEINVSHLKGVDTVDSENHDSFTYEGQTFHIVPFYEEVLSYTSLLRAKPETDKEKAFNEILINSFNEQAKKNFTALGMKLSSDSELKALEQNTLKLLENQDKINELIKEALEKAVDFLPITEETTIYIFPLDPNDYFVLQNMNGVGGATFAGNNFVLMIDPTFVEDELKYATVHEYHHVVNILNNESSFSNILDYTLIEGKADAFTKMVYPEHNPPWIESLSEEEESIVLEELQKHWNSEDFSVYNELVYGNYVKKIPQWSNYKIGFQIINSYLMNNPNVSIMDWTKLDTEEVVKGSEFRSLVE